MFCAADTIAKQLAGELAIVQIAWTRYVVFALMALLLTTRMPGAAFRTRLALAAIGPRYVPGLLVAAVRPGHPRCGSCRGRDDRVYRPILVTFLSIPLLGEKVDVRRWLALTAGMVGVLVVLAARRRHPEALFRVASATRSGRSVDPDAPHDGDRTPRDHDLLVRRFRPRCPERRHSVSLRPADRDAALAVDGTGRAVVARTVAGHPFAAPRAGVHLGAAVLHPVAVDDAGRLPGLRCVARCVDAGGRGGRSSQCLYTAWRERRGADRFADKAAFRQHRQWPDQRERTPC